MTAAYEVVNLRQRLAVRKYLFRPLGSRQCCSIALVSSEASGAAVVAPLTCLSTVVVNVQEPKEGSSSLNDVRLS